MTNFNMLIIDDPYPETDKHAVKNVKAWLKGKSIGPAVIVTSTLVKVNEIGIVIKNTKADVK